jgi:acetyl esterase/lipase
LFAVLSAVALAAGLAPAQQPPAQKAKEPRPDMSPVLGPDTVAKTGIPFGKDEKQQLDVYRPKTGSGLPVVVYVHGGEWTKGDKAEVSYKPKFFTENGVVFVSTNYRLYPGARFPAHAEDVAAAVRWAVDHAAEYGGDPKKVVLMGHSAGCHLATLVALDPQYLAGVKLTPGDLRGVVAWSGGAYDLVSKVAEGGSYKEHVANAFGPDEAAWRAASPVTHARNGKAAPPLLFASYEKGNPANVAAERLAGLVRDAGGRASVVVLENRTHTTANHLVGAPGDKTGELLLRFIREVTR